MSLSMMAMICPAGAAPYIPGQDSEVLETLPPSVRQANAELRRHRDSVLGNSNDPDTAVALAGRFLELGQTEGDPRYLGYAQAALQAWWTQPDPDPAILLLRAALRQSQHEFDLAKRDLSVLLEREPRNERAWVLQAVIQLVQADYGGATKSCEALTRLREAFLAFTCLGSVASVTGQAQGAYELLQVAEKRSDRATVPEQVRLQTLFGKTAERLNDIALAERHYRRALSLSPNDVAALTVYADFLLDQDRAKDVLVLLKDYTRLDALLLRLALAEQRTGASSLAGHVEELTARYRATRERGDVLHQGDEAQFRLHLLNDPEGALRLAVANWAIQREPRDGRILLEAALAARNHKAAQPVLDWLQQHHLEDRRMRAMGVELRGQS